MDTHLAQALQTVESELRTVNEELGPKEQEVAVLRKRLAPLERSVATLEQKRDALAAAVASIRTALDMAGATATAATAATAFSSDSETSPPDHHLVEDRPSNGGSTDQAPRPRTADGVVAILTDLGGMGSLEAIRHEFRRRGWLDPEFKDPDAALYAATKRLTDRGRVERLGEGRYRLVPERPNGEAQEGGM